MGAFQGVMFPVVSGGIDVALLKFSVGDEAYYHIGLCISSYLIRV